MRASDRWGTYTPETPNAAYLDNGESPYAEQDENLANEYSAVWNLNQIDLPSGGSILVDYEADDYAYVQDKAATRMLKITDLQDENGVNSPTATISDPASGGSLQVHSLYGDPNGEEYNYLFFDLEEPITQTVTNADDEFFYETYIEPLGDYLYFKSLVQLNGDIQAFQDNHLEYIKGYARLTDPENGQDEAEAGLDANSVVGGAYTKGWIKVVLEDRQDRKRNNRRSVHPFAKAAWQTARLEQPQLVYPGYAPGQVQGLQQANEVIRGLAGFWRDLLNIFSNENSFMRRKHFAQHVDLDRSYIRLPDGNRSKNGGGCRVKKIETTDGWDDMTTSQNLPNGQNSAKYGQIYNYTMAENGATISAGVAAYEPLVGG
ncbi:MAG: hypothetical protein AAF570_27710, partial [Bacteroidota bacterium]